MSENTVKLIFLPETPIPVGYMPAINMDHPTKKNERLLPDVIVEDDENGGQRFLFEVDQVSGRVILEKDPCYKLWYPAEMKVVKRDKKGAELVTIYSVDPSLAKGKKKAATPIKVPEGTPIDPSKLILEASKE